jgi:hypothetical protein
MHQQPAPRKRGGQPGNKNARKHGFYATRLLPSEAKDLAAVKLVDMADEIELVRIQIRRLLSDASQEPASLDQRLELIKVICIAVRSLNRLVRTQHLINPHNELLEELKAMADEVRIELESGARRSGGEEDSSEPYGYVPFNPDPDDWPPRRSSRHRP